MAEGGRIVSAFNFLGRPTVHDIANTKILCEAAARSLASRATTDAKVCERQQQFWGTRVATVALIEVVVIVYSCMNG